MTTEANYKTLDRLDTIGECLEAVVDLLIPEQDLHIVKRDRFATLLGFLQDEYRRCIEDVRRAQR